MQTQQNVYDRGGGHDIGVRHEAALGAGVGGEVQRLTQAWGTRSKARYRYRKAGENCTRLCHVHLKLQKGGFLSMVPGLGQVLEGGRRSVS